jgi:hypothetical protein
MKSHIKLILIVLLWCIACVLSSFGQTPEAPVHANRSMLLGWDNPDPLEVVAKWHVQVWSNPPAPTGVSPVLVTNTTTTVNGIELTELFKTVDNGAYYVTVIAEDFWGFQSNPSLPFWVFWYARPNPPGGLVVRVK